MQAKLMGRGEQVEFFRPGPTVFMANKKVINILNASYYYIKRL